MWNEKPNENIRDVEMWDKFSNYLRELGFSFDFKTKRIVKPAIPTDTPTGPKTTGTGFVIPK